MDVQRVRVVLFKDHDQVVQHGDVPGGIVGGGKHMSYRETQAKRHELQATTNIKKTFTFAGYNNFCFYEATFLQIVGLFLFFYYHSSSNHKF